MGSERKRPAPPTSSQTLAAQKSAVREMALFEPRTYFLRFLVRRGPLGQNLRIFGEKISISTENGCRALLYYVRYRQTLQLNHLERITRGRILFV